DRYSGRSKGGIWPAIFVPRSRSETCPAAQIGADPESRRTKAGMTLAVTIEGLSHGRFSHRSERRNEEGPRRAPLHERWSEPAPRAPTDRLEHEPERELQVAHLVLGRGARDLPGVGPQVTDDTHRIVRLSEVDVVEDVHDLQPELQVGRAAGTEPFEE